MGLSEFPSSMLELKNGHARVVVLVEGDEIDPELRAFSNHSVDTIDEWKDPLEDEVWK